MISTDEIKNMLGGSHQVDKQVWEDLIREVDENGDGQVPVYNVLKISLQEFKDMMMKIL